ncbi:MAG: hydrogenase maturation nickel metallochaperone HypA [Candidatus Omnitrophota bacterium]
MHELQLVKNIISIIESETADIKGDITAIYLEIGKLRYIVPELLSSAFRYLPKEKKLERARIEVAEIPVKVRCLECGSETVVDGVFYSCGKCRGDKTEIVSGKEFLVKGVEWEDGV